MSEKLEDGQVFLKSYDDFQSFVNKKIDEQTRLELSLARAHAEWVSVQNLLDILKSENKFLSKDKFINLVSAKKLRIGNPYNHFGTKAGSACDRTIRWYQGNKEDTLKERKKYWDYVKKCLFGNPKDSTRGLINIDNLTNNDIGEIINLICSDLTIKDEESFFTRE